MKWIPAALLLGLAALPARAQDTRAVTEPAYPPAGALLSARLAAFPSGLAEADESRPDTARLQAALDRCPRGQAVELKADGMRNAFLTAPIELRSGVTLLIDRGVTLFASRNPRDYDLQPGVAGTITERGHGARPLIRADHVSHVAIMGDGVIDGRGGARMLGQSLTWWQLAAQGRPHALQNNPRLVVFANCDDVVLYRIQLRDSPNFHVSFSGGDGFTVWGVVISTPASAHNGDGIDIGQPWPAADRPTTNVTVTHCFIHAGDDIVAVKAPLGFLTSHVSVVHNHFYSGHGMSFGSATSGGIEAIRISDLTIDGPANAIHLKSNLKLGGLVRDVEFDHVWVRRSRNPLFIETHYDSSGHEVDGDDPHHPPGFEDIRFRHVYFEGGGRITLDGLDAGRRLGVSFEDVWLDDPKLYRLTEDHAAVRRDGCNFPLQGEDVAAEGPAGSRPADAAAAEFPPFPAPITPLAARREE